MASGVVTVGRYRYAVGLYWENSPGSGRVAQIAKEAATQPGQQADFYAIRPGSKSGRVPQFGLSSAETGQSAGMPALAGCLASQVPGSWAGAFRLNEGIVVTVIRDDLVVPDGDLFFSDEAEARERLIQEIGFGGLRAIYAPESWSIPGADAIPLTLLLNDSRDIKLQQVTIPQRLKLIAAGLTVFLAFVVIGVWYWQASVDEENMLRTQREEAIRRAQDASKNLLPSILQQQAAAPKYVRKWEEAPSPLAVIEACRQGLGLVPAAVAGWKLSALKCTGSTINTTWTRDKGFSGLPPGGTANDSGTEAYQAIVLPELKNRPAETLGDPSETMGRYLATNWPGNINRASDDPIPPPPKGYTGAWNPPPPPWVKRSFTLHAPELPGNIPALLGDLPGVVVNEAIYTPSGLTGGWEIQGVIYENRK